MGTLKARPLDCLCPTGAFGAPRGPACPLLLCDCVRCVIRCDTKTSLSSSLCQPAALHWKPALTAMTLQPDWNGDPLTPSHRDGAQIHHYYMQTSGRLLLLLLYSDMDAKVLLSASASVCFCSLFPAPR